jgi:hypothetical protein
MAHSQPSFRTVLVGIAQELYLVTSVIEYQSRTP